MYYALVLCYLKPMEESSPYNNASKKAMKLSLAKKRLINKVTSLKDIILKLKNRDFISEELSVMLEGVGQIFRRMAEDKDYVSRDQYDEELRSFAITLYRHSPKAYRYVRKSFKGCLPHPKTLRKWYRSADGKPDFSEETSAPLGKKV